MTQAHAQTKSYSRKPLAGVAAVAAFAIVLSASLYKKENGNPGALLSYKITDEEKISTTLQRAGGTIELEASSGEVVMPAQEKLERPYILSSFLHGKGSDAHDFVFSVSRDGVMTVLLDGFRADDAVTLALNSQTAFKDVPMDWSGRIELTSKLAADESVNACVEIAARGITLCHHIPKGSKV